ncbi:MAG: aldo/keto reductase [Pseudomonadota bacterium]
MTALRTLSGSTPKPYIFGTMQWGDRADEAASRAMFEACQAAGICHFDTAHVYTNGNSETLLGKFASSEREALYVATKVAYTGGSGRANITRCFDTSRQRLNMDVVDLLYLHRFDDQTPLAETFETLADLQSKGLIRHIGVSNFAAWQVVKAQGVAASFGTRIDVIQPMYSLVKRQAEVEILPMAHDLGLVAATYSPLGGGLLTGKYVKGATGRLTEDTRYAARYGQTWMHSTAETLADLAHTEGVSPATLAVAWVAKHKLAPQPILSARSVDQLQASLEAVPFEMSDSLYAQITSLSIAPAPATDRLEEA